MICTNKASGSQNSTISPFPQRDALWVFAARDVHNHTREQVQTRLDRIEENVFRIGGMAAVTLQAEAFDDRRLGIERGKGGIGAAAFRYFIHHELLTKFAVNLLRVLGQGPLGSCRFQRWAATLEVDFDFRLGQ